MLIRWRLSGISNHQGTHWYSFHATVISCGLGGRVHDGNNSTSRSAPSQTEWFEKGLDCLIKGYNTSGRFQSQLDDNYSKQWGINVGQRSVQAHFWDWDSFIYITKKGTNSHLHLMISSQSQGWVNVPRFWVMWIPQLPLIPQRTLLLHFFCHIK